MTKTSECKSDCKVLLAGFPEVTSEGFEHTLCLSPGMLIRSCTGAETIEKCLADPAIRFLVMDVALEGMNGFEVTQQIRKIHDFSDLVIILVGWYSLASVNMALAVGCNEFIVKPLDHNVINGLLNETYKEIEARNL